MANKFSQKAENAITRAGKIAEEYGHTYIGTEHLLQSLSEDILSVSGILLAKNQFPTQKTKEILKRYAIHNGKTSLSSSDMTPKLHEIIENACRLSVKFRALSIGTEHLLSAILDDSECMGYRILLGVGTDIGKLREETTSYLRYTDKKTVKEKSVSCPNLEKYGKNLVSEAKRGNLDPVIGREKAISRALVILCRKNKNNPLFLGEAGVGKTAIVEGIANRIAEGKVPPLLKEKTIYQVDLGNMISGTKYRGDFEERIKGIVEEAQKDPNIILFIDEIHTLVGAGAAEGAIDAANILKPELARGSISVIGATTDEEYRKTIEKDAALARRFQPIEIKPATIDETVEILRGIKPRYEKFHSLCIDEDAILQTVQLSIKYIPERHLPDKAIDLLDETCSMVKVNSSKSKENQNNGFISEQYYEQLSEYINIGRIDKAFSMQEKYKKQHERNIWDFEKETQTVVTKEDVIDTLKSMYPEIQIEKTKSSNEIYGRLKTAIQCDEKSLQCLADMIFDLQEKKSKTAILGFVHLSVSQNEIIKDIAKEISFEFYKTKDNTLFYHCALLQDATAISSLLGSNPGYVGYDNGTSLTDKVKRKPFSVLVFEDIDKAHQTVIDLIDQLLSDGKLTDHAGKTVDFSQCLVIITTQSKQYGNTSGFITTSQEKNKKIPKPLNEKIDSFIIIENEIKELSIANNK